MYRGSGPLLVVAVLLAAAAVGARAGAAAAASQDASISISPSSANSEAGAARTLTITVAGVTSPIARGSYTATASIINSGGAIGDFVGPNTCTYTDASPSCTVEVTSQAAGTSKVSATTSVTLTGLNHQATPTTGNSDNTAAGGSGPASLSWVQGSATLNPAGAIDAVGAVDTITATAGTLGGSLDGGSTFAASITGGPGGFVNGSTCSYTPSTPSCTLQISSSQAGVTTVHATTTMSVGGVLLTRDADYSETWVDGKIALSVPAGPSPVGGQQTVTVTVTPLGGALDPGSYNASLTISKPGAFVGGSTCTYSSDQPTCTVTVTSGAAGTATISANSTFKVSGLQIKRATGTPENGAAGGSDKATVSWSAGGSASSTGTNGISIGLSPRTQSVENGGTARFTVTVTNTGTNYLSHVTVADSLAPHCGKGSGDIAGFNDFAPGAASTYTCSLAGISSGFTNSAFVSAQGPRGDSVTASDSVQVTVGQTASTTSAATTTTATTPAPGATVTVTASHAKLVLAVTPKAQTVITRITKAKTTAGATITIVHHGTAHFTIRATNAGSVGLSNLTLVDRAAPGCVARLGKLAVGTSKTLACTRVNVVKKFTNVVSATAKAQGQLIHVAAAPVVIRVAVKH